MNNKRLLLKQRKAEAMANCRMPKHLFSSADAIPDDFCFSRQEVLRQLVRNYLAYFNELGTLAGKPLEEFE